MPGSGTPVRLRHHVRGVIDDSGSHATLAAQPQTSGWTKHVPKQEGVEIYELLEQPIPIARNSLPILCQLPYSRSAFLLCPPSALYLSSRSTSLQLVAATRSAQLLVLAGAHTAAFRPDPLIAKVSVRLAKALYRHRAGPQRNASFNGSSQCARSARALLGPPAMQ